MLAPRTALPAQSARNVCATSPFMRMTAFRDRSGRTRVRSGNASSTLSHFGRKRTGGAQLHTAFAAQQQRCWTTGSSRLADGALATDEGPLRFVAFTIAEW